MRKSNNKFTLTKIALSVAFVGTMGGVANAQWAVTNVNDAIYYPGYFGPTGIFTKMMGQMINASKAATDQNSAFSEINRKQAVQFQEDTDQRNRMAMGQHEVAKQIAQLRPTPELCAALTAKAAQARTSRTANGGGSSAGKTRTPDLKKNESNPKAADQNPIELMQGAKTEIERNAFVTEARAALNTCSQVEIDAKIPGCIGVKEGKFSGNKMLPASDISPLSLFGNTDNEKKTGDNAKEKEFANRTIVEDDQDALNVSRAYINNLLLSNMPITLTNEQLKSSPDLEARSRIIRARVETSAKALRDIYSLTVAPKGKLDPASAAGKYWDENKSNYENLLGMKAPDTPSMRDYLLFQVTNDFLGIPKQTANSGDEMLKIMIQQQALNNYIAFRSLETMENVNVQLASLVAASVSPVNVDDLNKDMVNARNNDLKNAPEQLNSGKK